MPDVLDRGAGAKRVTSFLQPLFVPMVVVARGGIFPWFMTSFSRLWVCLRDERLSKRGGIVVRRESPRLASLLGVSANSNGNGYTADKRQPMIA